MVRSDSIAGGQYVRVEAGMSGTARIRDGVEEQDEDEKATLIDQQRKGDTYDDEYVPLSH